MGIPKFFRFISERWPQISDPVEDSSMLEFDCLYLDMNSILHNCTHSNDGSISRLTEEQMFSAIFAYIDHLVNLVKPQQSLYMAIDGVAPRAKMNQQRSRRFRTAVDAEKNLKKAIARGEPIPKEDAFDTNAITPGTEFMASLTKSLKFFIHQKVSSDSQWQDIEIIFSGHEVPGEGEHKIMEYIRTKKAQKDYNPNLRHCIYGLDADLIILGLSTHDPHFAILREEVVFGRQSQVKTNDLTNQKFYLLHLSLVREYLQLEFQELKDELSFTYDFERVLDDFILVLYVIGNDFLPNLPDLHLNKGAFPLLIQTFKDGIKSTDGYLNENGEINLTRLGTWLEYVSNFELGNFEKNDIDVEWFNKQLENISLEGERKRENLGKLLLIKQQKKLVGLIKPWILKLYSEGFSVQDLQLNDSKIPSLSLPSELISDSEVNMDFIKKFAFDLGLIIIHSKSKDTYTLKLDIDGMNPNDSLEDLDERLQEIRKTLKKYQSAIIVEDEETFEDQKKLYDAKFDLWKERYYKEKFGWTQDDKQEVVALAENYVEGLQWVLYYYYKGCPSWPWYFKYHYAPRISDVKLGLQIKINFNKGTPFKPIEQLMAVLPARSRALIPPVLRSLMIDPNSPIIDYFPEDVEIDMNGKTADWEAVVKLPFVDENRLIDAMKPYLNSLTPQEKSRNEFGNDLQFIFNPQMSTTYYSPIPTAFANLEENHCGETIYKLPSMEGLTYVSGLCENALTGKNALSGFPSLYTVPFNAELKNESVTVFNQPSKQESMILTIKDIFEGLTVEQFAKTYCGKNVYINWPILKEAKVTRVVDDENEYELLKDVTRKTKKVVASPLDHFGKQEFTKTRQNMISQYLGTRGVRLNSVKGIVFAKRVTGLVRTTTGAYVKTYADSESVFPIQLVVEEIVNPDERFKERAPLPIEEEFPLETQVVFLGSFAYGSPAKIIGHEGDKLTVHVSKISKDLEPQFGLQQAHLESQVVKYYLSRQLAKMLNVPSLFFSRITSTFLIRDKDRRQNVGIPLKFQLQGMKALGYTRRSDRGWEYSALAIELLKEYFTKYPKFIKKLIAVSQMTDTKSLPTASDLDLTATELDEIKKYCRNVQSNLQIVTLESESLSKISILKIESQIINFTSKPLNLDTKGVKGIPRSAVMDPSNSHRALAKQVFKLGHRVVYLQSSGLVPIFSKGTVVGIKSFGSKNLIEVLFDNVLMSGTNMDGRLQTRRGLTIDSSSLLNLTQPQLVYQSKYEKSNTVKKQGSSKEAIEKAKAKLQLIKEKKIAKQKKEEKAQHELLNLIKGGPKEDITEPLTTAVHHNNDGTVQNIFSSVMGNVMGPGIPQAPLNSFRVDQQGSLELKDLLTRPKLADNK